MPKQVDPEVKARAIWLVNEYIGEYSSLGAAAKAVGKQLGAGQETVRRWAVQSEIDSGQRAGLSTGESEGIKRLKNENRRLREDVTILKAAMSFFVGEPGPRNR